MRLKLVDQGGDGRRQTSVFFSKEVDLKVGVVFVGLFDL